MYNRTTETHVIPLHNCHDGYSMDSKSVMGQAGDVGALRVVQEEVHRDNAQLNSAGSPQHVVDAARRTEPGSAEIGEGDRLACRVGHILEERECQI